MKKTQLFLLHFAGGNVYSYQFVLPMLKQNFDTHPLELPGRGRRFSDPLLKQADAAIDDLLKQILDKMDPLADIVIYGHSMGASLGLQIVDQLEKLGHSPKAFIASGNPGPGIKDNKNRYLMPHVEFVKELRKLGGVPEELFENEELFELFEPMLRSDFELLEKEELSLESPVSTPIVALMGSTEEKVEAIENWSKFTQGEFKSLVLEGDHFFIHDHPDKLAEVINEYC
jgi:external thioesterase TEII